MKLVILLIGLAIAGYLVATQLRPNKHVVVDGVDQGTPKQILDHTRDSVNKSMQQIQQQANRGAAQAAAAANR